MEPFGSILGALGSIASLVSLAGVWRSSARRLRFSLAIVFLLTAASTGLSVKYYQSTQPERMRQSRQVELRKAINGFLKTNNLNSNYWQPGQNEGIVNSGLMILEIYKDLVPDTYAKLRHDADAASRVALQNFDKAEHRVAMDNAARNMLTTLHALAGGA